ncbi:MAG: hypothetical protein K2M31_03880 [Muribaculaceae bacterium]|nr:hypothetical protein [Muribaculaceae bacterium]
MNTNPSHHRAVAIAIARDNSFSNSHLILLLIGIILIFGALMANAQKPRKVSAEDLVSKVYGVADPGLDREDCRRMAEKCYCAKPIEEDGAEWMSASEGFAINYEGHMPESEAMARYDNDNVAGYGYIFYFPYNAAERDKANREQCRFCSALLGELNDMGAIVGANPLTDALFDVGGIYKGSDLQLTLSEYVESETQTPDLQAGAIPADRKGQFIIVMSVTPAGLHEFTAELESVY